MLGLIPTENWEHNFIDLLCGLGSTFDLRKKDRSIRIDGLGECFPVRTGRAGLAVAIKALNLRPGASIGVPLFCCPVVFKAIETAGCKPYFIDVDPETFCISPDDLSKKCSHVDAIIAVHMFGNLCDMNLLQTAAQGKPIIEDCAQSIGSKLGGQAAGSYGTVAFFSFRSGKYLSAGEGGALFARDQDICARISGLISKMRTPTRSQEYAHVVKTHIKSKLKSQPLYGIIGLPLWKLKNKKLSLGEKSGVALSQIFMSDLTIINKRLPKLDSVIQAQRSIAKFYTNSLKLEPRMLCEERPGTFYNRYHYPITFLSEEQRDFIADYMFDQRIATIKYLNDVLDIATRDYDYQGGCPVAEQLSRRVLIIPSYYSLHEQEVQQIAQRLNEGLTKIKNHYHSDFI